MEACLYQRSLLDQLLADHSIFADQQQTRLVTWYLTPMALEFSAHLKPNLSIYDCMDELSNFHGAPTDLKSLERQLMARVGLLFTGGIGLYEAKRPLHSSVHAFPSSIDVTHFGQARKPLHREPEDQAAIPHPRVGFFGVIDERFDVALLASLAKARPDLQFVMLGPVVKIDPSVLPSAANIHWLGQKAYEDLPAYLAGWDAGIMPFALNDATRYISPTKTPEFLAAGLPVVSTAVPDVIRTYGSRGLVAVGDDHADFAYKLECEMAKPREERLLAVDAFLATMSWDRTWAGMDELISLQRERVTAPSRNPMTATVLAKGALHV